MIIDKSDKRYKLAAAREPNMTYFSKSDIACLKNSLSKYGSMAFDDLYNLIHSEKCYYETASNEKIDYALLIDDDNPFKEEILENIKEFSQYTGINMSFTCGNAYLIKFRFTRPHRKEKYAICVCEDNPLFFFISSNPRTRLLN
ncbi:MAG: hypothetical protein HN417_07500 [Desulfobacula sp.]|nr:hypothetical protein [Desulfobacula sp.]